MNELNEKEKQEDSKQNESKDKEKMISPDKATIKINNTNNLTKAKHLGFMDKIKEKKNETSINMVNCVSSKDNTNNKDNNIHRKSLLKTNNIFNIAVLGNLLQNLESKKQSHNNISNNQNYKNKTSKHHKKKRKHDIFNSNKSIEMSTSNAHTNNLKKGHASIENKDYKDNRDSKDNNKHKKSLSLHHNNSNLLSLKTITSNKKKPIFKTDSISKFKAKNIEDSNINTNIRNQSYNDLLHINFGVDSNKRNSIFSFDSSKNNANDNIALVNSLSKYDERGNLNMKFLTKNNLNKLNNNLNNNSSSINKIANSNTNIMNITNYVNSSIQNPKIILLNKHDNINNEVNNKSNDLLYVDNYHSRKRIHTQNLISPYKVKGNIIQQNIKKNKTNKSFNNYNSISKYLNNDYSNNSSNIKVKLEKHVSNITKNSISNSIRNSNSISNNSIYSNSKNFYQNGKSQSKHKNKHVKNTKITKTKISNQTKELKQGLISLLQKKGKDLKKGYKYFLKPKNYWMVLKIVIKTCKFFREVCEDVKLYGTSREITIYCKQQENLQQLLHIQENLVKVNDFIKKNNNSNNELDNINEAKKTNNLNNLNNNNANNNNFSNNEENIIQFSKLNLTEHKDFFEELTTVKDQTQNLPRYIIQSDNFFANLFYFFVLLSLFFILPFRIAFSSKLGEKVIHSFEKTVIVLLDVLLFSDFVLEFFRNHYYIENHTKDDFSYKKNMIKYFSSYQSWLDILQAIPFGIIEISLVMIIKDKRYSQNLEEYAYFINFYNSIFNYVNAVLFISLIRMVKFPKLSSRLKNFTVQVQEYLNLNTAFITISNFLIETLFYCHIFACIWLFVGFYYCYIDENSWIMRYSPNTYFDKEYYSKSDVGVYSNSNVNGIRNNSRSTTFNFYDSYNNVDLFYNYNNYDLSYFELYLKSIYFSVTIISTIGFGDITAYHSTEILIVIVWMVFCGVFYSSQVSKLTSYVSSLNKESKKLNTLLDIAYEFFNEYNIKKNLQDKITTSINVLSQSGKNKLSNKQELLSELPLTMRIEITTEISKNIMEIIPFFADKDSVFVAAVLPLLQPVHVIKQEVIYKIYDIAYTMFFIEEGIVSFLSKHSLVYRLFKKGFYFGDIELLLKIPRISSAVAFTNCRLLSLSKEIYNGVILNDFTDIAIEMLNNAPLRFEKDIEVIKAREKHYKMNKLNFEDEYGNFKDGYLSNDDFSNSNEDIKIINDNNNDISKDNDKISISNDNELSICNKKSIHSLRSKKSHISRESSESNSKISQLSYTNTSKISLNNKIRVNNNYNSNNSNSSKITGILSLTSNHNINSINKNAKKLSRKTTLRTKENNINNDINYNSNSISNYNNNTNINIITIPTVNSINTNTDTKVLKKKRHLNTKQSKLKSLGKDKKKLIKKNTIYDRLKYNSNFVDNIIEEEDDQSFYSSDGTNKISLELNKQTFKYSNALFSLNNLEKYKLNTNNSAVDGILGSNNNINSSVINNSVINGHGGFSKMNSTTVNNNSMINSKLSYGNMNMNNMNSINKMNSISSLNNNINNISIKSFSNINSFHNFSKINNPNIKNNTYTSTNSLNKEIKPTELDLNKITLMNFRKKNTTDSTISNNINNYSMINRLLTLNNTSNNNISNIKKKNVISNINTSNSNNNNIDSLSNSNNNPNFPSDYHNYTNYYNTMSNRNKSLDDQITRHFKSLGTYNKNNKSLINSYNKNNTGISINSSGSNEANTTQKRNTNSLSVKKNNTVINKNYLNLISKLSNNNTNNYDNNNKSNINDISNKSQSNINVFKLKNSNRNNTLFSNDGYDINNLEIKNNNDENYKDFFSAETLNHFKCITGIKDSNYYKNNINIIRKSSSLEKIKENDISKDESKSIIDNSQNIKNEDTKELQIIEKNDDIFFNSDVNESPQVVKSSISDINNNNNNLNNIVESNKKDVKRTTINNYSTHYTINLGSNYNNSNSNLNNFNNNSISQDNNNININSTTPQPLLTNQISINSNSNLKRLILEKLISNTNLKNKVLNDYRKRRQEELIIDTNPFDNNNSNYNYDYNYNNITVINSDNKSLLNNSIKKQQSLNLYKNQSSFIKFKNNNNDKSNSNKSINKVSKSSSTISIMNNNKKQSKLSFTIKSSKDNIIGELYKTILTKKEEFHKLEDKIIREGNSTLRNIDELINQIESLEKNIKEKNQTMSINNRSTSSRNNSFDSKKFNRVATFSNSHSTNNTRVNSNFMNVSKFVTHINKNILDDEIKDSEGGNDEVVGNFINPNNSDCSGSY